MNKIFERSIQITKCCALPVTAIVTGAAYLRNLSPDRFAIAIGLVQGNHFKQSPVSVPRMLQLSYN